MVDITLFELHLDGAEFTANAPGSGAGGEESGDADGTEADSSAPLGLFAGVALVVLLVAAVAVRKLSGDDGDPLDDGE